MQLICGFYHRDGQPAKNSRLEKMIAAMIEPGLKPQVARLVEGSLALAVLDFSRKTPFEIARGTDGYVLAADCRLDEPEALSAELGIKGRDEDLLLTAMQRWGAEGVVRLLGDFAFVAWNPKTCSLLCARDSLGIRPFYMTKNSDIDFAFASLPRALHAGGFATRRLDQHYLVNNLLNRYTSSQRALFSDVSRLPPAHLLHVSVKENRAECYWKLNFAQAGKRQCSPEVAASELSAIFTEAVRCRLPKTGPVAAHLSGGLDSSAISVLAARMLRKQQRQLLAYSFLPKVMGEEDERPFVEAVLRQETDICWKPVTVDNPDALFRPKMDCDQLFASDLSHPDIQVCVDAKMQGAEMLLSGWGGDEGATFNGRGALAEALQSGRWRYLLREIIALKRTRKLSVMRVVNAELLSYLFPDVLNWLRSRLDGGHAKIPDGVLRVLRPGFASCAEGDGIKIGPNALHNRYALLSSYHIARRTEHWALMSARQGIAVSFPMLDRRLVEFVTSLPSSLFLRNGWKRSVFRDAMVDVLPEKIRRRRGKLNPIPEVAELLEAQRQLLLPYLTQLRAHEFVCDLFDLDEVERIMRSEWDGADIPTLMRFLNMAAYLKQHH